jgi:type VI protein secretion system component Hcp
MNPFLQKGCLIWGLVTTVAMTGNLSGSISATASGLGQSFAVESFGLGVNRRLPPGTPGGTADINIGIGELREIHIRKKLDTASTWLFENVLNGLSVGTFVFHFTEADSTSRATYLLIGVEGARVQSWSTSLRDDGTPVEELTLHYHRFYIETFSKVGDLYVSNGIQGWDLDASIPWTPARVEVLTARDDAATVSEDVGGVLDVLANDQTLSAGPLAIMGFTVPDQGGTVEVTSDGSAFRYVPPANFFGEELFLYTVGDGSSEDPTATANVRVVVRAVNDLPVAAPDRLAITQAGTHTIHAGFLTANDQDVEGDALRISQLDTMTALGGTVRLGRNDWIIYTPPADFVTGQVDSFHYWVADETGVGQGDPALQRGAVSIALQRTSTDTIIRSLTASRVEGGELTIRMQGVPDATYSIEQTGQVGNETAWSPVREVVTDDRGQAEFSQPLTGGEAQEYFRAIPSEP